MESVGQPFIRCEECSHRAFIVRGWRPSWGLNPLMRKWVCDRGHDTYWAMTRQDIKRLAVALPTVPQSSLTREGL